MSKIDRVLVEKLDSFTSALEDVVEILKIQIKEDKAGILDDAINGMGDTIIQIAEDLREIKSDISDIKTVTNDLKKTVDKLKEQNNSGGIFGDITKDKEKIKDGVAIIGLIAVGVLSVGMAFKIIGKVDTVSVMSLSIGLFILSKTFVDIHKNMDKDVKMGDIIKISLMLPIMSAALALSGFLLSFTPNIGWKDALSITFISIALGFSLFTIGKLISSMDIKAKDIWKFLLLPLILPAIAAGISLSSYFLTDMNKMSIGDAINIALTSLVVGLSTLALLPTIYLLKLLKVKITDVLIGSLSIVILSGAISASAYLLSLSTYDKYPNVDWAIGVGLSLLAFGISAILLASFIVLSGGLGAVALLAAGASIIGIAGLMVGVAGILNTYNWGDTSYPSWEWSLGVGSSLIGFSVAMVIAAGATAVSSIVEFFTKEPPLQQIAKTMISVASELDKYDWQNNSKHPTSDWAISVGSSLVGFSVAMVTAAGATSISSIVEFFTQEPPLQKIARTMIEVATELDKYNWDNTKYPSLGWSTSVGMSLAAFGAGDFVSSIGTAIKDSLTSWFYGSDGKPTTHPFIDIAKLMIQVATELDKYDWSNTKYPSLEWTSNVGASLSSFGAGDFVGTFGNLLKSGPNLFSSIFGSENESNPLISTAELMGKISNSFNNANFDITKMPTEEWSKSVINGLSLFSKLLNDSDFDLNSDKLKALDSIGVILTGFNGLENVSKNIDNLSKSIDTLSNSLKSVDIDVFTKLTKFSGGIKILSTVNSDDLNNVIKVIDDKKSELSQIISLGNKYSDDIEPVNDNIKTNVNKSNITNNEKELSYNNDRFEKLMTKLESMEYYLSEILDIKHIDAPTTLKYSS